MRDWSLHLLDLAQNSVKANASLVTIAVAVDTAADTLAIDLTDDGCGMTPEFLARVRSPFTTTRTTRKVGLGIPLFQENVEKADGTLDIHSEVGKGTRLHAVMRLTHIDRLPIGDLGGTLLTLVLTTPLRPDYVLTLSGLGEPFTFDTRQLREVLGDVPLDTPDVAAWMRDSLAEGVAPYLSV